MKAYAVVIEDDAGNLGIVRNTDESLADFINRVLWTARTSAALALNYVARLEPPDAHAAAIARTATALVGAVDAFGKDGCPCCVAPAAPVGGKAVPS
jgi:hypothetical protein